MSTSENHLSKLECFYELQCCNVNRIIVIESSCLHAVLSSYRVFLLILKEKYICVSIGNIYI